MTTLSSASTIVLTVTSSAIRKAGSHRKRMFAETTVFRWFRYDLALSAAELVDGAHFGSTVLSEGTPISGRKKEFTRKRKAPEFVIVTSGRIWIPASEFSIGWMGGSPATGATSDADAGTVSASAGVARARQKTDPSRTGTHPRRNRTPRADRRMLRWNPRNVNADAGLGR